MAHSFQDNLARFEAVLSQRPLSYDALLAVIRDLDVPSDVDDDALTRYFACCYRILDLNGDGFGTALLSDVGPEGADHIEACASEMVRQALYDRVASNRAWVEERIAWFRERGKKVPKAYLENDLPPALNIPWDLSTARARLEPLLNHWESRIRDYPTAHFDLCWRVRQEGYPVFREIIGEWMRALEAEGVGEPNTIAAFETADELLKKADGDELLSWEEGERDVVPLLDDPHPMVVAGAARYLGALYTCERFTEAPEAPDAPDLIAMLTRLSTLPRYSAIACGGFICGFDTDCSGLYSLASDARVKESGFDIHDWILALVERDDYEPYLPNAQALWFYIHEFYDCDPEMVTKFLDRDRAWLALMCATEAPKKIDGMEAVLKRLANGDDAHCAGVAKAHLQAYYS